MFSGAEHTSMSSKYTSIKLSMYSPMGLFINLCKVDGALHNPSGSKVYSNKPYLVTNAVFSEASLARRT